ncbi:MBL fold metallo-hydrolase [Oxalobacter vibrioformis]|uniref:MBL fold metallo-hydrolase n=1 Tax=Oxalobacter vibrioformis TaxID=933080 RepID=A0A9E9LW47_9BURK|nr:MBL fold metallo-hydrolase [Oxalobacter vibrioformis]WAW10835.1 MBL fold metallo-hydrolase [Oxalobacter vibrioformis]
MKFSSLGSGSKGNALLVSASDSTTTTNVMLDCGFGVREMERRLARSGMPPSALSAIIITHEHSDHAGSVFQFAARHDIPVWMSYGTFDALGRKNPDVDVCFCRDGDRLAIGDLQFSAFTVPHDAREPLQFHVTDGDSKFGVLTDVGQITSHLVVELGGCDALMIECNHDVDMLAKSAYPYFLKKRISSVHGHLSNEDAAQFIESLDKARLKTLIGAHLSQQNNCPGLVRDRLETAVSHSGVEIRVACQDDGFNWLEIV